MPDEPKLTWGREPRDLMEHWPRQADGTPEEPVFLTDVMEADSEADLLISLLRSYDIPVMKRYERDGTLGRVVLGFSGYGARLYVPQSMLEDAQNLIQPVDDTEIIDQEDK